MLSMVQLALMAASATQVAASCAFGTHLSPRTTTGVVIKDFGYSGSLGPANWHSLNVTTNHGCATGVNQSPINLVDGVFTEVAGSSMSIEIPDFVDGAIFENIGTAVEVVAEGGSLVLPGSNKTFSLLQFHFHLPAEHLDNGTTHAMEVHMVFQADDSELAVLGTYIDIDNKLASCDPVFSTLFASAGEITEPGTATTTAPLIMQEIVAKLQSTTFKNYSGSLTTPPCSEGVNWFVNSELFSVTVDTWKAAQSVIRFNSRFPQGIPGEENVLGAALKGMNAASGAGFR